MEAAAAQLDVSQTMPNRLSLLAATALALAITSCDAVPESAGAASPRDGRVDSIATVASAQSPEQSLRIVLGADSADYYAWIETLVAAPTMWVEDSAADNDGNGNAIGIQWRLVVVRSEIYVSLFLEQITLGNEGCCAKLALVRRINMERIADHFAMRGEMSQIERPRALGPATFGFTLRGIPLELVVLSSDSAQVRRAP